MDILFFASNQVKGKGEPPTFFGLQTSTAESQQLSWPIQCLCTKSFTDMTAVVTESCDAPFILLELLFSQEGDYIEGIKEINAFPKEPQVPLVYSHVNTSALEKVTTKYLVVLIE